MHTVNRESVQELFANLRLSLPAEPVTVLPSMQNVHQNPCSDGQTAACAASGIGRGGCNQDEVKRLVKFYVKTEDMVTRKCTARILGIKKELPPPMRFIRNRKSKTCPVSAHPSTQQA
jgi:hypothetical protein